MSEAMTANVDEVQQLSDKKQSYEILKDVVFSNNVGYCEPSGDRTHDTLIKSQLLYQLSYEFILN